MGGFGTGLLSVLVAGATLVIEAQPEPARTLELLERERVTLFRGWPDQADALAAHPAFASTDLGGAAARAACSQSSRHRPRRGRAPRCSA